MRSTPRAVAMDPDRTEADARPERRAGRHPRRGQGGVLGGVGASAIAENSGRDMLSLSLSAHDPNRNPMITDAGCRFPPIRYLNHHRVGKTWFAMMRCKFS